MIKQSKFSCDFYALGTQMHEVKTFWSTVIKTHKQMLIQLTTNNKKLYEQI